MGFRRQVSGRDTGLALNNKDIALHAQIEKEEQEELDAHLEPEKDKKSKRTSKSSKPDPPPHDHKKAHRPIKSSRSEEPERPEPSRESQPYHQTYANLKRESIINAKFLPHIEPADRLSDTATSAITAVILLCVFLFWGYRYQARQRLLRAEKDIVVIIGDICSTAPRLHPNMLSYEVVTRKSNMDSSLVSVLIGVDKLKRQCFLRQTEPHKRSQRVEYLRAMYDEMKTQI